MKYLYKILRLFRCPHKFSKLLKHGQRTYDGKAYGYYYDKECRYCGKIKEFRT